MISWSCNGTFGHFNVAPEAIALNWVKKVNTAHLNFGEFLVSSAHKLQNSLTTFHEEYIFNHEQAIECEIR